MNEPEDLDLEEAIELPIDGTLDLHTFSPREVKALLADYIAACRERGILSLRIVHGKGTGQLRALVQAQLARHPAVREFSLAGGDGGSWGATLATLAPLNEAPEDGEER